MVFDSEYLHRLGLLWQAFDTRCTGIFAGSTWHTFEKSVREILSGYPWNSQTFFQNGGELHDVEVGQSKYVELSCSFLRQISAVSTGDMLFCEESVVAMGILTFECLTQVCIAGHRRERRIQRPVEAVHSGRERQHALGCWATLRAKHL